MPDNLLVVNSAAWITGGPGSVTIAPNTGAISLVNDGTAKTYARRPVVTVAGKRYRLTWSVDSTLVTFAQVGTTAGGTDLVGLSASVVGDNAVEFVATTTTTYVEFSRSTTTSGSPSTTSNFILEERSPEATLGRRLNGRTQHFSLNAFANGLRTANNTFYIGGWFRFNYMPTAATYIMDFGRSDLSDATLGNYRVRIVWDAVNTKLLASNGAAVGTGYYENSIVSVLRPNTWIYMGCSVAANGATQLIINKIRATTVSGSLPVVTTNTVCRELRLGVRSSPGTAFAPGAYADWVWCSGFLPTAAQIDDMADGVAPTDISGFTPTYYWPMTQTGDQEASITGAAVLTAVESPIAVVGPRLVNAPIVPTFDAPMEIIII